jgi:hypothetical protein
VGFARYAGPFATKPSTGRFRYALFESFIIFPPTKNHPCGWPFVGIGHRLIESQNRVHPKIRKDTPTEKGTLLREGVAFFV